MSNLDIVRAWKDEEYRSSLTEEQLALLPVNPAGDIELTDAELSEVEGGTTWWLIWIFVGLTASGRC